MRNIIRKYREMSFEYKTVLITVIGLCFSAVLAIGKLVIGLFADYNLCTVAVYTFAILMAKLECVLGIKTNKLSFKTRNTLVAVFLFLSSIVYIGFMVRTLFIERAAKEQSLNYVVMLAFISFCELGFAIAGILRVKSRGHLYRNIKIINFCVALIAILTTQIAILNFTGTENRNTFNSFSGIGVGVFIALCALFILFAPKISVINREHNVFELTDFAKNKLIDTNCETAEITLCRSRVYGSFIFRAQVQNGRVSGNIERGTTLWKRMHVLWKILCCILSEILLPAWLIGRFVFMLRSMNLPKRLEKTMSRNGFTKIE